MKAEQPDNKKKLWGRVMLCLAVLMIAIKSIFNGAEREETWRAVIAFFPAVIFIVLVVATVKKFSKKDA